MTTIQPVTGRADLKRFIEYPYAKYRGHPTWVPPLLIQEWDTYQAHKNPFFQHSDVELFLALEGGRVVGRVAAIRDENYNRVYGENACLFAAFEAESEAVALALFAHVETWARARGCAVVRGPSKVEQNDMHGFLIENFDDPPTILMNYNPPEYPRFAEASGYAKAEDTLAWKMTVAQGLPERVGRIAERIKKNLKVSFRPLNFKNLDAEVPIIRTIYNAAWANNYGFVPWTEAEIDFMKNNLKQVADQKLCFIAEVAGQPVAFTLVLPDINEGLKGIGGRLLPFGILRLLTLKPKRMRLLTLGILPEYQGRGIDALLYAETFWRGQGTYAAGEFGWTLESNDAINNGMKALGAVAYKRYRIFEKRLDGGVSPKPVSTGTGY